MTCHQFPDADGDREHLLAELAACRNEIRRFRSVVADDLTDLTALGVDHIQLRAVLAGGRWHIDGEWVGHDPDAPQTSATETSGHFERLASLAAVVATITEQAVET